MRFASAIAAATLLAAGAAQAQETPAACRPDAQREIDYQACADAAPKGSPIRALALINLGSEAVMAQNFTAAVRFYDEAVPPGQKLAADAAFHAFRARAFDAVGRKEAAVEEARTALDALDRPVVAGRGPDPDIVLSYILPIFYRAEAPEFSVPLSWLACARLGHLRQPRGGADRRRPIRRSADRQRRGDEVRARPPGAAEQPLCRADEDEPGERGVAAV
jgi:hypothetical protein